ncbi:MAG: tyrosine-protein phosphatase [Alphaproteobacteria bacterium]|nr:tyrosine-protein phosphatase [Alphaproteobacteria bacterium]
MLLVAAGGIGGYWGILQYEGNVHTVVSGQLYRAAQPDRADLVSDRQAYGIKSVLNLRGAHHGEPWYDNEVAAAGELGMAHYDYPLSAKRVVTEQQIAELLALVRAAPKPLLIHCKSGADRTGLLSALYRYAESGATAEEADGELTLIYGHFPYLTNRTAAMDESFWAYVRDHNVKR